MSTSLVFGIARPEMTPVIAGENYHGVLIQPQFLEGAQNCADGFIDPSNASVIFRQLVGPVSWEKTQVVGYEGIGIALRIALRCDATILIILVMRLDIRNRQQERFLPLVLEKVDRQLSHEVDPVSVGKVDGLTVSII